MPSMASRLLLRASRDLARAARVVASRCAAPVARSGSGSGGPAYPRSRLPSSFRRGGDAPPSALAFYHPPTTQQRQRPCGLGSPSASEAPPLSNSNMAADRCTSPAGRKVEFVAEDNDDSEESDEEDKEVEFVVEDKDIESDEAMWALYKRWCKAFNQRRDHDEMLRRFGKFKQCVLHVVSSNKADLPYKLEVNKFADGKQMENMLIYIEE